jgi:kinesin family protein 6/9
MGRDANIEVVARIRPSKKSSGNLTLSREDGWVEVHAPREDYQGEVNNRKERHTFGFSRVLDPQITQEEVFDSVAKPVCDSALEGFNATIFAYGQTGSGKTFTITGGAERYVDRGIIPRSISHIFAQVSKRSAELVISVQISYLEIYNESAYDLLDPSHDTKSLEDLPKVFMLEDENGVLHTRNLGIHPARSEEDALNLLFIGDTNRMIAETPMNMASSRSHCIFTMIIETRKAGSDTIRKSKLNFVDLAGSERVKKTGVEGTLLRDARYINISLHFLEQVIVALHERSSGKARNHIPYRNSMMTMVLRDSLGGNCKTTMIATMAAEDSSLPETISTCRFAQRVAQISNRLEINEEVDPKLMIARLKAQVVDLKAALAEARGERGARGVEALSAEERARCEEMVNAYVADVAADAALDPSDMAQVQYCCRLLRARALAAADGGDGSAGAAPAKAVGGRVASALAEGTSALELQLQQRDHEIAILVSMLKKKGEGGGGGGGGGQQPANEAWTQTAAGGAEGAGGGMGSSVAPPRVADAHAVAAAYGAAYGGGYGGAAPATPNAYAPPAEAARQPATPGGTPLARQPTAEAAQIEAIRAAGLDPAALLKDRNASFELFRKSYRKNQVRVRRARRARRARARALRGLGALR